MSLNPSTFGMEHLRTTLTSDSTISNDTAIVRDRMHRVGSRFKMLFKGMHGLGPFMERMAGLYFGSRICRKRIGAAL